MVSGRSAAQKRPPAGVTGTARGGGTFRDLAGGGGDGARQSDLRSAVVLQPPAMRRRPRPRWALACVLIAGCSYANRPLNDGAVMPGDRAVNRTRAATFAAVQPPRAPRLSDAPVGREIKADRRSMKFDAADVDTVPDGYFVGLALSGGGSRSANFAAACMFQLQRVGLLQKVDYLSTVSGGSLAGAYYCLNGDGPGGWNPKAAQEKLTHPFATDMLVDTLLPWNLLALTVTDYDRSDLLAKTLRANLFTAHDGPRKGDGQTYADLRPDRPRLLVNATDLQSGRRFVFCNETFDSINSDLAAYPISYAVSASSSVPVVLHEVTLRDFATIFPQYRHLIDGGVSDNLGIQTLVETYRSQEEAARAAGRPDPYPHGALFVVVDARVEYDRDISTKSDTGLVDALTTAAGLTASALLNRASSASLNEVVLANAPATSTAREIRDALAKLDTDGYVEFDNVGHHRVRVAHMALTQLENVEHLPFRSFQESVNSTSTYFNIDSEKAYQLYVAADLLMHDRFEPAFRAVLDEMDGGDDRGPATRPATGPATRP